MTIRLIFDDSNFINILNSFLFICLLYFIHMYETKHAVTYSEWKELDEWNESMEKCISVYKIVRNVLQQIINNCTKSR